MMDHENTKSHQYRFEIGITQKYRPEHRGTSIDIKGIDDILVLFKKFANERKINIFLVHHSELKEWFFDRIVTIKKGTFSYIEEKYINQ